jgi:hypothetical protein
VPDQASRSIRRYRTWKGDDVDKLSQILWRERELLEQLAYELEIERLVLASGRTKWLANATRDIDETLTAIRSTEVLRAVAADEAAEELGLTPNPSLAGLAEVAGDPWRAILHEHRDALLGIAREIAELSEDNKGLLTAGYRSAQETLLSIGGASSETYTHDGRSVAEPPRRRLVDRSL